MPQGQPEAPVSQTLIERHFLGLNLSAAPAAIADGEFLELENLMPYADGNLAVMPGPQQINTAPTGVTISEIWTFVFNTLFYIIVQGADGSINIAHASGSWTQLAAAGSTTVNGLHMIRWNGADAQGNPDAVLWVDTTAGYGSLTPTTWTVLQPTIPGQCLAVYAGRVWIGSASEVIFTAPDTYNDFNAADYAGGFKITDSSFNGSVVGLYSSQNWLYIVGSGMMALNNVQVQSVAGSTALVTTYFLTPVSASVAISNDRAALVYDNVLLLVTGTGIWAYYGLNGQQASRNMGDNFSGSQSLTLSQVFGRNLLITSAGYVLMFNERKWFTILADVQNWVSMTWLNDQGIPGYIGPAIGGYAATTTAIYEIGRDFVAARACIANTKLFDAGNGSINKRCTKMGLEVYPNELISPLPTSIPFSGNMQLLGYIGKSAVFQFPGNAVGGGTYDGTINNWLPSVVNLTDRYFSMKVNLTAWPGSSIGAFFVEFQDSASWPTINSLHGGGVA